MRQRIVLNAALIAVVAVLAALLHFSPGGSEEQEPPLLTQLVKEHVDRIRIEHGAEPIVSLQRVGSDWRMVEPYPVAANAERISQLLDFLQARSVTRFPVVGAELSKYGLDQPGSVLLLNDDRFEFGIQHPLKAARYVRYGDNIHLVADIVTQHLTAGAEAYVDPALIAHGSSLAAIAVPGLMVTQNNNVLAAAPPAMSTDAIARFIEHWRAAQAIEIRRATDGERTAAVTESVQFTDAAGNATNFLILARTPALQLLRRDLGLVYEVPADLAASLLTPEPEVPDHR